MTDTPVHKRKLWQIHLNTAVALSVLSGLLLFLNLKCRASIESQDHERTILRQTWGWPFDAVYRRIRVDPDGTSEQMGYFHGAGDPTFCVVSICDESADGILGDAVIALGLIAGVVLYFERRFRRRSKP